MSPKTDKIGSRARSARMPMLISRILSPDIADLRTLPGSKRNRQVLRKLKDILVWPCGFSLPDYDLAVFDDMFDGINAQMVDKE